MKCSPCALSDLSSHTVMLSVNAEGATAQKSRAIGTI